MKKCKLFCVGGFDYTGTKKTYDLQAGLISLWYMYECPFCGCGMSMIVGHTTYDGELVDVLDDDHVTFIPVR